MPFFMFKDNQTNIGSRISISEQIKMLVTGIFNSFYHSYKIIHTEYIWINFRNCRSMLKSLRTRRLRDNSNMAVTFLQINSNETFWELDSGVSNADLRN